MNAWIKSSTFTSFIQVILFLDYCSHLLYTIFARLHVGISASLSMIISYKYYKNYITIYMSWRLIVKEHCRIQSGSVLTWVIWPPIPITEVLESQPLKEAKNVFFCGHSGWQPPWTDDMILNFGSVHCFHVLIIFAKLFVLILHICLHIPLHHLI